MHKNKNGPQPNCQLECLLQQDHTGRYHCPVLLISATDSIFEANKTQRCLNSTTATADNSSRVHVLFSPQRVGVLKLRATCGIRHAVNHNPFAPACARLIAHPSSFNNCSSDREGSRRVRIENVGWRSATRQGSNEKQSGQR